jgi:aminopeptidase N
LHWYGPWFGPYPYGHITVIDPAYQSESDGMEYPTLITAGTRWLIGPDVTSQTPEEVTLHEAGHQFWYGIIGSNEFEHAWMDEGFNTFATARAMQQDFPVTVLERRYFGGFVPWVFRDIRLSRETVWNRLAGYRPAAESDPLSTPSYRMSPRTGRFITYNKTALWLNTMERWLGWTTLQRILGSFYREYQFKHPTPENFFSVANRESGQDLGWFFDQVYRSSNVFDYGIETLKSTQQDGQYRTSVMVRRYGEAVFPVPVRITFEGGAQVTEHWDGRDRWKLFTYARTERALAAQVDPDRVLLLDVDYTNNSRTLKPQAGTAATKWALKWMVWLQDSLLTWAFFA